MVHEYRVNPTIPFEQTAATWKFGRRLSLTISFHHVRMSPDASSLHYNKRTEWGQLQEAKAWHLRYCCQYYANGTRQHKVKSSTVQFMEPGCDSWQLRQTYIYLYVASSANLRSLIAVKECSNHAQNCYLSVYHKIPRLKLGSVFFNLAQVWKNITRGSCNLP